MKIPLGNSINFILILSMHQKGVLDTHFTLANQVKKFSLKNRLI